MFKVEFYSILSSEQNIPQPIDIHGALPKQLGLLTLAQAHALLGGDRPDSILFIVWLLENPNSLHCPTK